MQSIELKMTKKNTQICTEFMRKLLWSREQTIPNTVMSSAREEPALPPQARLFAAPSLPPSMKIRLFMRRGEERESILPHFDSMKFWCPPRLILSILSKTLHFCPENFHHSSLYYISMIFMSLLCSKVLYSYFSLIQRITYN